MEFWLKELKETLMSFRACSFSRRDKNLEAVRKEGNHSELLVT